MHMFLLRVYIYMYVYVYTHLYVHVHIHICTYTYIYVYAHVLATCGTKCRYPHRRAVCVYVRVCSVWCVRERERDKERANLRYIIHLLI